MEVGDIIEAYEHARELERERDELAAWKKEALLVESRWDCQKVAKLLGISLGEDIRPNIEPKIRALLDARAQVEAKLNDALVELRQTRENLYHDLDRDRDDITTPHLAVVAGSVIAALRKDVTASNTALEGLRRHTEEMGAVQMKLESAKELRDETIAELVTNNARLTAALTELLEAARVYKQHLSAQAVIQKCDEALGEPVAVEDRPMPGVEP